MPAVGELVRSTDHHGWPQPPMLIVMPPLETQGHPRNGQLVAVTPGEVLICTFPGFSH